VHLFKSYFEATHSGNDQCTPENPFFFLKSDGFWHLHACAASAGLVEAMTTPGSWAAIVDRVSHASLDGALFTHVATPIGRQALRDALVSRYFPDRRTEIIDIALQEQEIGIVRDGWESDEKPGTEEKSVARDAAFSRTVRQAYDYRCAACGIRFIYEDTTLIDAAHVVPWAISKDDRPQNGMALCKNHHWVMDERLLAPGPDHKWHVSKALDDRIEGQAELLKYDRRDILLPTNEKLRPLQTALEWRFGRLR
jgi:putative restriction endonuclease